MFHCRRPEHSKTAAHRRTKLTTPTEFLHIAMHLKMDMKLTTRKVQLPNNQDQWTEPDYSLKYGVMCCACTLCGGRVQFQGSIYGVCGGEEWSWHLAPSTVFPGP